MAWLGLIGIQCRSIFYISFLYWLGHWFMDRGKDDRVGRRKRKEGKSGNRWVDELVDKSLPIYLVLGTRGLWKLCESL